MFNLRRFIILSSLIIMGISSAYALTVLKQKEKYGYANNAGEMVIKAQYTQAYPFENGKAKVCKGKKWGYIDTLGKAIIPIQYENIEPFKNGIARVKKGDKYGYICEDGSIYIKPDYNFIGTFNDEGYIWVAKGKTLKESKKGLFKDNQPIIEPKDLSLGFYVGTDSADYTDGSPISFADGAPENNEIKQNFCKLSISNNPYIWLCSSYAATTIADKTGKIVVKQQSNRALGMPHNGYSITRQYSKKDNKLYYTFNYVAADGNSKKLLKNDIKQLIDVNNIYESCLPFNGGFALCGTESTAYIIDTNGQPISKTYNRLIPVKNNGYISLQNERYGLVAPSGAEIVAPSYKSIIKPSGTSNTEIIPAQDANSNLFGFIDFKGNVIIPFEFENAAAYINNRAYVKNNGFWGIVDNSGKYIVKNRWKNILFETFSGTDHLWVQSPSTDKWQCLQVSTDQICINDEFDGAGAFDSRGRALVMKDKLIGAIDTEGNTILPIKFNSTKIANVALNFIDQIKQKSMNEFDAYRFNIYNNDERHKHRLHQTIADNMWDF